MMERPPIPTQSLSEYPGSKTGKIPSKSKESTQNEVEVKTSWFSKFQAKKVDSFLNTKASRLIYGYGKNVGKFVENARSTHQLTNASTMHTSFRLFPSLSFLWYIRVKFHL